MEITHKEVKRMFCNIQYSAEIKTEVLQIIEAFSLGIFLGLLSFEKSTKIEGYIFTQFRTTLGTYNHYYRMKDE